MLKKGKFPSDFETSRDKKLGSDVFVGIDAPGQPELFYTIISENRASEDLVFCFRVQAVKCRRALYLFKIYDLHMWTLHTYNLSIFVIRIDTMLWLAFILTME
jgi:hypothetical protein